MTRHVSRALLQTKSDAVLVALAQGGSDSAFSALVDRHRRSLHRHCRTLVPDHDAEDIVQQTFVRALRALRSGVEVRDLGPWLHGIAHNVALTELASRGARHDELDEGLVDCQRSGEFDRRAELSAALAAVASLPDVQRTAVVRWVGGESHAAIAQELGVSVVAARQILHRARARLRAAVQVVVPPPLLWLVRRGAALAERVPTPPPAVEAYLPKIVAAVVGAAVAVVPSTLMHANGSPLRHAARAGLVMADSGSLGNGPFQLQATASSPGGSIAFGAGVNTPMRGGRSSALGPNPAGSLAASHLGGGVAAPGSNPATANPSVGSSASSNPSAAAATTAVPGATSTDTTSTDTTSTDTTSTDTTSTDTTSTDTTTTDTTTTDTTSADTTLAPPSPTYP